MAQLELAEERPAQGFTLLQQVLAIQESIQDRLGIGSTYGYLSRIAGAVGAVPLAIGLTGRALATFASFDDRYGQSIALHDLGRALLRTDTVSGVACLLEASRVAASFDSAEAAAIEAGVLRLRAQSISETDYEAMLNGLREQAPDILRDLFAQAEAAIAAGELDLYRLPEGDDTPEDA